LEWTTKQIARVLADLNTTLTELSKGSKLKQMVCKDDITRQISDAYKELGEALQLFSVRVAAPLDSDKTLLKFLVSAWVKNGYPEYTEGKRGGQTRGHGAFA
jgi:hypothetical protein